MSWLFIERGSDFHRVHCVLCKNTKTSSFNDQTVSALCGANGPATSLQQRDGGEGWDWGEGDGKTQSKKKGEGRKGGRWSITKTVYSITSPFKFSIPLSPVNLTSLTPL